VSYPLAETSRELWRRLRDAQPEGLRPKAVIAVFGSGRGKSAIRQTLQHMRRKGYIRYEGVTKGGTWHVGAVTLPGEQARINGVLQPPAEQPEIQRPLSRPVQGRPKGVPASVWELAQRSQPCA
jgi:hypothetical protein